MIWYVSQTKFFAACPNAKSSWRAHALLECLNWLIHTRQFTGSKGPWGMHKAHVLFAWLLLATLSTTIWVCWFELTFSCTYSKKNYCSLLQFLHILIERRIYLHCITQPSFCPVPKTNRFVSNSSEAKLETVRNLQHFKFASNLLFELQKSRWHPIILLAGWYGVLLWAIIIPLLECSPLQINEPRIFLWLICLWDIYFLEPCSSDSFFNVFVMSSSFLGMAEFGWRRLLLTWDVGSFIIKLDGKRLALIQDSIIMTRAEIIAMKVCSAISEGKYWHARAAKAPLDLLQLSGQDLAKATRPNRLICLLW